MKKKLFSIIMCILMIMCFMPTSAFAEGYDGTTAEKAWQVSNATELKAALEAGGYISITQNFSFEGDWTPVSLTKAVTIDGNNHTLSGLRVTSALQKGNSGQAGSDHSGYYSGLIGKTNSNNVTIENLTIYDANVGPTEVIKADTGYTYDHGFSIVGVLVGNNDATAAFNNVHIKNSEVAAETKCGLFVGSAGSKGVTLTNCSAENSKVNGHYSYALLVGLDGSGKVSIDSTTKVKNCETKYISGGVFSEDDYNNAVSINGYKYGKYAYKNNDGTDAKTYYIVDPNGAWVEDRKTSVNIEGVGYSTAGTVTYDGVASIDGWEYQSLQAAINAAGENDIVTLIRSTTISESTTVKNLTISDGVTLNFSGTGKLIVTGTLKVDGTLDLNGVSTTSFTNDTAGDNRTLKIANDADLIVNGTLKSKAQFNDILQLGTMTINSGATVIVGKISETDITYIGTGGTIVLGTGAQIVQKPREANTFAEGYTYELSGSATVGSLDSSNPFGTMYVSGKDQFIVNDKATLTVNKMAMAKGDATTGTTPTFENHIIVKEGGTLAVAENGELDLTISEGQTTYSSDAVEKSTRLILIEQGGFFNVSGTVKSNNSFNDICQFGKMTINSAAKYMASSTVTYMGPSTEASAVAQLASGATVVSEPNTANSFADGYTYTLTGNAEAGIGTDAATAFAIGGNDRFIVKRGSTLTATNMKLAGAKSDQLIIESGAKLNGSVSFAEGVAKLWKVSSGTFTFNPSDYLATSRYYVLTNGDGTYTVYYSAPSGGSSSGSSTTTDNVVNTTETTKTDAGATTTVPETKATVKAETKTAADGTKITTATVDTTTASKIVEKAVENKSEEVVVSAAATPVAETAAGTTTEVAIPAETISQISEKTEAAVTIESEAAKVTLDKQAVAAVAEQAGETGTVSLVVETVSQDANKVEVEIKLETSNGKVSDFKGGSVIVTVKLNSALAGKEVTCVYIDDNGNYHKVAGIKSADGTFTFVTGHFSTYAIMSVEEADAVIADQTAKVKALVSDLSLKASSTKTKKGSIKVSLKVSSSDIKEIEELGYTVKYKFYRSTKKASSYKAMLEKAGKTYTNTTGKKGTRYYYKARVTVYDSEGTLVAKTALTQCKYATRIK